MGPLDDSLFLSFRHTRLKLEFLRVSDLFWVVVTRTKNPWRLARSSIALDGESPPPVVLCLFPTDFVIVSYLIDSLFL